MTTKVVNLRNEAVTVYIGRPSKWSNPYRIGPGTTRAQAIEKYREYIVLRPDLLDALGELRGKNLGCWCAPLPCHGDVLVELLGE